MPEVIERTQPPKAEKLPQRLETKPITPIKPEVLASEMRARGQQEFDDAAGMAIPVELLDKSSETAGNLAVVDQAMKNTLEGLKADTDPPSPSSVESTAEATETEERTKVLEAADQLNGYVTELYALALETPDDDPNKEQIVRKQLVVVFEKMHSFAALYPPSNAINEEAYTILSENFSDIVKLKGKMSDTIKQAFTDVFLEFSDFIDDEITSTRLMTMQTESGKGSISVEHAMREIYGLSRAEVEQIKNKNRADVVTYIKQKAEEAGITMEMLTEMYRINNRGIVPKEYADTRAGTRDVVRYGEGVRIGTLPEDVKEEMTALIDRADTLAMKYEAGLMNRPTYEVAVAQLHNDLIQIHPFTDRNGSTAILLMELMMAKTGYTPKPDRIKPSTGKFSREVNYYQHLSGILNENPVALGIVGYEHLMGKYRSGFYKGDTITPEKQAVYEAMIANVKNRRKRAQQEKEKDHPRKGLARLIPKFLRK